MDTELRERLEEAADKYALGMFDETASRTGFIHGAEWGYKEAIAQCKEWLEKKTHFAKAQYCNCEDSEDDYYNGKADGLEAALADFESDMNKLWEEQK